MRPSLRRLGRGWFHCGKAGRGGGGGRPEEKRLQRVREDEMMPPRRRAAQGTDRRATAAVERLRAFGGDGQAR